MLHRGSGIKRDKKEFICTCCGKKFLIPVHRWAPDRGADFFSCDWKEKDMLKHKLCGECSDSVRLHFQNRMTKENEIFDLVDINRLEITLCEGDFSHHTCNKCREKLKEKKYTIWVSFSFGTGEKRFLYELCESCTKKAVNILWIGKEHFNWKEKENAKKTHKENGSSARK